MANSSSLTFPIYISYQSTPVVWSWMTQLGSARKNSVTSFLSQAAETVLRFEKMGITFDVNNFEIDQSLFANPYEDSRLKSLRQNYRITVMKDYYPLLFDFLSSIDYEDQGKVIIPLIEAYLVAFWGQVCGAASQKNISSKNPEKPKENTAKHLDKNDHLSGKKEPKYPQEIPDFPSEKQPAESSSSDDKSKKMDELLGGSGEESNLSQWGD